MKAAILYSNLFDRYGKDQKIGGVETYLLNLSQVCKELDFETVIYQFADNKFQSSIGDVTVEGIPVMDVKPLHRHTKLFKEVMGRIEFNKDLVIFGTGAYSVLTKHKPVIAIQHGIAWDLPMKYTTNNKMFHNGILGTIAKCYLRRKHMNDFARCPNLVCVDYNFLNWYRTYLVTKMPFRSWVIPNFTKTVSFDEVENKRIDLNEIKILFARRFNQYRGTRLMGEAISRLLTMHNNVRVTFAGEGPDENWLRDFFKNESKVTFIKYYHEDANKIHFEHDIAIIPSLGSEGTSLSVAEAMGCGCAVVATSIGGITNMIIDGYNGVLVEPEVQCLTDAICKLIDNPDEIKRIGRNAYTIANESLSLIKWKKKWGGVINTVCEK